MEESEGPVIPPPVEVGRFRPVAIPSLIGIGAGITASIAIQNGFAIGLGTLDELIIGIFLCAAGLSLAALWEVGRSRSWEIWLGLIPPFVLLLSAIYVIPICGISLAVTVWAGLSLAWAEQRLPPFRLGIWWGMGGTCGVISGSVLAALIT